MGKKEFIDALGATESISVGKPGALSAVETLATLEWHDKRREAMDLVADVLSRLRGQMYNHPKAQSFKITGAEAEVLTREAKDATETDQQES